jgi:hypothetical protein
MAARTCRTIDFLGGSSSTGGQMSSVVPFKELVEFGSSFSLSPRINHKLTAVILTNLQPSKPCCSGAAYEDIT